MTVLLSASAACSSDFLHIAKGLGESFCISQKVWVLTLVEIYSPDG
jgi:hypothetical protein